MPKCSPAMTSRWMVPVAMKFSVRPASICSRWPKRTASAISAHCGIEILLQQPIAAGAHLVEKPRETEPAAGLDHRNALRELRPATGYARPRHGAGRRSRMPRDSAGPAGAESRAKQRSRSPAWTSGGGPCTSQRGPARGRSPARPVAHGHQVDFEPAALPRRQHLHRIEGRRGQPAGHSHGHGFHARRLGLGSRIAAQIVAGQQIPAAMVPRAGRGGHGQAQGEAARAATRAPPPRQKPAPRPPAAMVHHAHNGSGQNRSSRMPAAAAANTITNG